MEDTTHNDMKEDLHDEHETSEKQSTDSFANDPTSISMGLQIVSTVDKRKEKAQKALEYCRQNAIRIRWYCNNCNNPSFGDSDHCEKCMAPKPQFDYIQRSLYTILNLGVDGRIPCEEWLCGNCYTYNFMLRPMCRNCSQSMCECLVK